MNDPGENPGASETWENRLASKVADLEIVAGELGDIIEEKMPGSKAAVVGPIMGLSAFVRAQIRSAMASTRSIE